MDFKENIEAIINKANKTEEYFDKPVDIHIEIGGEEVFRAICKMIVSFYMQNGGQRQQVLHLLPYILDATQENLIWHYYPNELLNAKSAISEIVHRLFIKAISNEKLMYGYVEFFSTFKFLILMSDNYLGEDFQRDYCFDVLNQTKLESYPDINLTRNTILEIIKTRNPNLNSFNHAVQQLWLFIDKKQTDNCINNIIEKSIYTAFESVPEGALISEEKYKALIENLSRDLANFLDSKSKGLEDSQEKNLEE